MKFYKIALVLKLSFYQLYKKLYSIYLVGLNLQACNNSWRSIILNICSCEVHFNWLITSISYSRILYSFKLQLVFTTKKACRNWLRLFQVKIIVIAIFFTKNFSSRLHKKSRFIIVTKNF